MADRPRDRLGRPLPWDADPATSAPPVADITGLDDADVWSIAMRYIDDGLPFHAHEVFEARWRTCDPASRPLWRGLAQWGAALTHAARGNDEGRVRLAARALETLASVPHVPDGLDVTRARLSCGELLT